MQRLMLLAWSRCDIHTNHNTPFPFRCRAVHLLQRTFQRTMKCCIKHDQRWIDSLAEPRDRIPSSTITPPSSTCGTQNYISHHGDKKQTYLSPPSRGSIIYKSSISRPWQTSGDKRECISSIQSHIEQEIRIRITTTTRSF